MEEQGLWKDPEIQGPIIYKVTEFYDWHNCDPDIVTTIFWGKEIAESYMSKRMREIPDEMFNCDSLDELNIVKNPDGSTCIHNDNDYWTISIEKDEIVTSVFHCIYDIEKDCEKQRQRTIIEEHNRMVEHKWDFTYYNTICNPFHRETPLFESEK